MKNFLVIFVMAFAFFSCEGPMGPMGPEGPGTKWEVLTYEIRAKDWKLVENAGEAPYFIYEFDEKRLTEYIYEVGTVAGYLFHRLDNDVEVQYPLPCEIEKTNNTGRGYTEKYSFDFTPGSVAFYVKYDGFIPKDGPGTQFLRIVMNW